MADIEQKAVLTVDFDIDRATKRSAELQKEITQINARQKELRKSGRDTTVEYQKNETALRELKGELRENRKEIDNNIKATKAAEGSNNQLRAELSNLTRQYNALSREERDNTKAGQALGKQIRSITDELKENESAIGDNRRNVGNYADALSSLPGPIGAVVNGIRSITAASLQFIATPIGAILAAIAAVFLLVSKAISRSEERMGKLSKVTAVASGLFNALIKIVGPLADIIIDGLVKGIDLFITGLEKLEGFLGITNDGLSEQIRLTQQLAQAELNLNKARRLQEKTQLKFQLVAERLRQIRDDESRSIDERIKANQQLGRTLENQIRSERKLAKAAVDAAKLRIQAEGESTENLDRLAEAELKLLEIQERVESQRSEQLTNENSLLKEQQQLIEEREQAIIDAQQRRRDFEVELFKAGLDRNEAELQAVAEKYDRIFELLEESGLEGQQRLDAELKIFQLHQRELTEVLKSQEEERNKIAQEASDKRSSIQDQIFRNSLENNEREILESQEKYDALYQQLVDANLSEDEFNEAEKELIRQQESEISAILADQQEERTDKEKEEADKRKAIEQQLAKTKADLLNAGVDIAIEAAGENKEAIKGISVAAALGSTYAAINKTLAEPTLLYPSNLIAASAIGLQGLLNVARIRKLKKGGVAGGKSHEQGGTKYYGEDGNVVELEKGERWYVLNKNSSRMINSLSDLNVAGGGVPFSSSIGRTRFQDGGVVEKSIAVGVNESNQLNDLLNRVIDRPVFASIEEIRRVNAMVEVRESTGSF